jgi:hypothetical protein
MDELTDLNQARGRFRPFVLIALIAALAAAGLVLAVTPYGVGTSPDSAVYLGTAAQLLQGQGLTVPFGNPPGQMLSHYPPLYPLALALFGLANPDLAQSARLLQAGLFAANTILWALILYVLLPRRHWLAGILVTVLVAAPALLVLHSMAWSEGLFLLLGFAGLLLAWQAAQRGGIVGWVAAGDFFALAFLTRYAGAAFSATALFMLVIQALPLRDRVTRLAAALLSSLIAAVLWFGYSAGLGNRSLAFHWPDISRWQQGVNTLAGWLFIPASFPGWFKAGAAAVVFGGILLLTAYVSRVGLAAEAPRRLANWLVVFALLYSAFLLTVLFFVDANLPLDDRILAPLLLTLFFLGVYGLAHAVQRLNSLQNGLLLLAGIALVLWFGYHAVLQDLRFIQLGRTEGLGFYSRSWRTSPTLAELELRNLPEQTQVASNSAEAVYLLSGRSSISLPRAVDLTSGLQNADMDQELADLAAQLHAGTLVVVYFDRVKSQVTPDLKRLQDALHPENVIETGDGWLLIGSDHP